MNKEIKYLRNICIILIASILFTFTCYSQKEVVDSIQVFHPKTGVILNTIKKSDAFYKTLDKLNRKHKTDTFLLLWFFNDGTKLPSIVIKDKPKPEIL